MSLWQAVWIGAFQILSAVFPGTSRSMSTISSSQLAGVDPRRVARVQLLGVDSNHGPQLPDMICSNPYIPNRSLENLRSRPW